MSNGFRFQLGTPDQECRYPVRLDGLHIGRIYRWHGAWYAVPAGHSEEIRVAAGSAGKELAAGYLVAMYDLRQITPQAETEDEDATPRELVGPVPLLHPRMPATPRNTEAAHKAMAGLAEFLWTPLGGYPGADNPWFLRCQLCGWQGPRYWSHLRGRNGNPPSAFRHPGCLDAEKVRAAITVYGKEAAK
ncbi:hypothetical protein [Streptomyces sp. b62]|uniref:hypothetical protein n=1 Tax=Streptomyces sp. b62 TaxID=1827627 RepID=UPI000BF15EA1|nr:hypothetical protein [Streptomyces sp. b62]